MDAPHPSAPLRPPHRQVNNAGVLLSSRETSADGYELSFATHTLGAFALTRALEPALKLAAAQAAAAAEAAAEHTSGASAGEASAQVGTVAWVRAAATDDVAVPDDATSETTTNSTEADADDQRAAVAAFSAWVARSEAAEAAEGSVERHRMMRMHAPSSTRGSSSSADLAAADEGSGAGKEGEEEAESPKSSRAAAAVPVGARVVFVASGGQYTEPLVVDDLQVGRVAEWGGRGGGWDGMGCSGQHTLSRR